MKKLFYTTLLSIFAASHGYAYDFGCGNNCFSFQDPIVEAAYYTGKYVSIDKDYGELGFFLPSCSVDCWSLFLDASAYYFINGKWAASAGFGVRNEICNGQILGMNLFYDYRRGHSHHNFNQIGLGFEWLSNCWDLRANTYFNVGSNRNFGDLKTFDLGDNYISTVRELEYSYTGFDIEVGMPLFDYCDLEFYIAGGPYYYVNRHHENFWGGYGRAEVSWKSLLTAEIKVSSDKEYCTNVQGIFRVSLPFDFFCATSCNDCSTDCNDCCDDYYRPIYRNGIIMLNDCCNYTWNWDDRS